MLARWGIGELHTISIRAGLSVKTKEPADYDQSESVRLEQPAKTSNAQYITGFSRTFSTYKTMGTLELLITERPFSRHLMRKVEINWATVRAKHSVIVNFY